MKKLSILLVLLNLHLLSFGQTDLGNIAPKLNVEYVVFDFQKFSDEIKNLTKFQDSLSSLNSWYEKKQRLKGNLGASLSDKLHRNKEEESVMIKFALAIINYDNKLTHSVLQGEGDDYQSRLDKLIEKTQKGKVTPELGQIIKMNSKNVANELLKSNQIFKTCLRKLKDKQTMAEFNSVLKNNPNIPEDSLKDYIVIETVEEDNPEYEEALKKKKEKEMLAVLPHQKYSGKFDDGYAEYSYKEMPDGERVYDGKYFYKEVLGGNDYVITSEGQYKDDVRIGKWVWTYKYNGSVKSVQTQVFNFDENGYLHGVVSSSDSQYKELNYKITFNHGHIIGKYTNIWDGQGGGYINIEFDDNSEVVGTATYKRKSAPYMHYETYENGKLASSRVVNYETGEKAQGSWGVKDSFYKVVNSIVLSPHTTWLKKRNMSPDRKGPEIAIY